MVVFITERNKDSINSSNDRIIHYNGFYYQANLDELKKTLLKEGLHWEVERLSRERGLDYPVFFNRCCSNCAQSIFLEDFDASSSIDNCLYDLEVFDGPKIGRFFLRGSERKFIESEPRCAFTHSIIEVLEKTGLLNDYLINVSSN